ncbi:MAG: cob(I)yrinic acid a,c-diamide adenosyltransferase [bacterium]|nr:cob(I)yrinic acid a,c-diamide adenosyltransferase [bacterium]
MARIYTRSGDQGETSLGNGSRVSKNSPRVSLYGETDELNSSLGLAVALMRNDGQLKAALPFELDLVLEEYQSRIFDIGAVLASPELSAEKPVYPTDKMENLIDAMEAGLAPLENFILPGGHSAAAQLHVARTVSRRVERNAVALAADEAVPESTVAWFNRLGDFLFVAARLVNSVVQCPDIGWNADSNGKGKS